MKGIIASRKGIQASGYGVVTLLLLQRKRIISDPVEIRMEKSIFDNGDSP